MKPSSRILLTSLVALMVFSLCVGNAEATGDNEVDSWQVDIRSALYLDLDSDMMEDDVLTEYALTVPDGDWRFYVTCIYSRLTLPSGQYFEHRLLVIGQFSTLGITLGWYNTATESGWYTYEVYAWSYGADTPESGCDDILFDPPTGGDPGVPIVDILNVTIDG